MSTTTLPAGTSFAGLCERVNTVLTQFLDGQTRFLTTIGGDLGVVGEELRSALLSGGKRLRPIFCYWGWRGAGGDPDTAGIVVAAAAYELLHCSGLIHDDVIDGSDQRRGLPALHTRFAGRHAVAGWRRDGATFGAAMAILIGDLCLNWCAELFDQCALPAVSMAAARPVLRQTITEVLSGQCLDVLGQARGAGSIGRARRLIRYKTSKYTVERPLHLGGLLAGGSEALCRRYSAYALPLGEAFQLRDDILGVFGDPRQTGKPVGDDLREGKHTVLLALARRRAGDAGRRVLDDLVGDPRMTAEDVDVLRGIIADSGALAEVENLITLRARKATAALRPAALPDDTHEALSRLVTMTTDRVA